MMNQPLRAGGFSQIYDLAFSAVVSQFGNQPIATLVQQMLNTPIVYLGLKYKIEYVHILTGATIITVACNSLNQNA
jgi:hypothetical protein